MCSSPKTHGKVLVPKRQGDLITNLVCVTCEEPIAFWESTPEERSKEIEKEKLEKWV